MNRAWIGLGANLGRPHDTLERALGALEALPRTQLLSVSPAYWTSPWGRPDQPEFLNAVAGLQTAQAPIELLRGLLAIESDLGRVRTGPRWGPREIDLDLLLFDDLVLDSVELSLPHPRLHERAFVLVPLADLMPDLVVPGKGRVIDQLKALSAQALDSVRAAGSLAPQHPTGSN
jgi:2-amino-4-hydroxy-6-hydroxymethyldihydropteridine diphosphokinase